MNSPNINNVQRSIRTSRKLDAKVLKGFRANAKMTVKDAYILALTYATRDIELTLEDEERIIEDMRREEAKRRRVAAKRKGASK